MKDALSAASVSTISGASASAAFRLANEVPALLDRIERAESDHAALLTALEPLRVMVTMYGCGPVIVISDSGDGGRAIRSAVLDAKQLAAVFARARGEAARGESED